MYKMRFLVFAALIYFSHGDRRGGYYYRRGPIQQDRPPEYTAAYPMFCSPLTPKMYNHPTVLKDLVTLFKKLQNHRHFAKEFHTFMNGKLPKRSITHELKSHFQVVQIQNFLKMKKIWDLQVEIDHLDH